MTYSGNFFGIIASDFSGSPACFTDSVGDVEPLVIGAGVGHEGDVVGAARGEDVGRQLGGGPLAAVDGAGGAAVGPVLDAQVVVLAL